VSETPTKFLSQSSISQLRQKMYRVFLFVWLLLASFVSTKNEIHKIQSADLPYYVR
jgi:hypothetical protein